MPSTPAAQYRRASCVARATIAATLRLLSGVPGSAATWIMAMTGLGFAKIELSIESLFNYFPLPLRLRLDVEQARQGGRGIQQADRRLQRVPSAEAGARHDPRDGHVLRRVGAVIAIMPATSGVYQHVPLDPQHPHPR